jgi:hypothetical protein
MLMYVSPALDQIPFARIHFGAHSDIRLSTREQNGQKVSKMAGIHLTPLIQSC